MEMFSFFIDLKLWDIWVKYVKPIKLKFWTSSLNDCVTLFMFSFKYFFLFIYKLRSVTSTDGRG